MLSCCSALFIFVGLQIRQNNSALRASSFDAFTSFANDFQKLRFENVKILANLSSPDYEKLSGEERIVFHAMWMIIFNLMENIYEHHESGVMDTQTFEARKVGFKYH